MNESLMPENKPKKTPGLNAGWILVSGLILLCLAGTGLTWWNYSRQVYSSAAGVILAGQWPESRIAVELPEAEARKILIGHRARVTVGKETKVLQGEVVTIIPKKTGTSDAGGVKEVSTNATATVIVRLLDDPAQAAQHEKGERDQRSQHYLPTGAQCSVTIDTTVPPFSTPASTSSSVK